MSKAAPSRPRGDKRKRTFCIVASRFNAQYVDGLVDHATEELRALAPDAAISLHRVPGSFEIPVIVRELAAQDKADAVIACGVIFIVVSPFVETICLHSIRTHAALDTATDRFVIVDDLRSLKVGSELLGTNLTNGQ